MIDYLPVGVAKRPESYILRVLSLGIPVVYVTMSKVQWTSKHNKIY